jgi:CRISPR/Cas system-associated endoribonuclease Cas2
MALSQISELESPSRVQNSTYGTQLQTDYTNSKIQTNQISTFEADLPQVQMDNMISTA